MTKTSKTEDMLYTAMILIGLKPKRQYKISRMEVDFAFPEKRLVIEVDGAYKRNPEGMKTLFNRRRICEKEGWKVENFTAEEVYENPNAIAWRVKNILNKTKNTKLTEFEKEEARFKEYLTIPKREEDIMSFEPQNSKTFLEEVLPKEQIPPHKDKIKTNILLFFKMIIVCIILLILIILIFKNFILIKPTEIKHKQNVIPQDNIPTTPEPKPKKIEPLIIEGSTTAVIITNNQDKNVSLNVTYGIYSNWFGIDSITSQVFDVEANSNKMFKVYNNDGCYNEHYCSVSIISYGEKIENV